MNRGIPEHDPSILEKGAGKLGVKVPGEALLHLMAYCEDVEFWNRIAGITSYRTRQEILVYMFLDSLAPITLIEGLPHSEVLDLGTGGGFPGLPCRIVCPAMALTLLDSSTRKATFLQNMVKKLKLASVRVLCEGAGRLATVAEEKERYDLVLSRAFASLSRIARFSAPLLRRGGRIMAWKGPKVQSEIEECLPVCSDLHLDIEQLFRYTLPFVDQEMNIAVIRKRN